MIPPSTKVSTRPAHYLFGVLGILVLLNIGFFCNSLYKKKELHDNGRVLDIATAGLGLTDLCVATEARYTRHPAVSDRVVPFMDHPGAMDHFPTGSFWSPPYGTERQQR